MWTLYYVSRRGSTTIDQTLPNQCDGTPFNDQGRWFACKLPEQISFSGDVPVFRIRLILIDYEGYIPEGELDPGDSVARISLPHGEDPRGFELGPFTKDPWDF